jgi:hypothetical protein
MIERPRKKEKMRDIKKKEIPKETERKGEVEHAAPGTHKHTENW